MEPFGGGLNFTARVSPGRLGLAYDAGGDTTR